MKSKLYSILVIAVLSCQFLLIFIYSKDVMDSITFSISIWKDNLLPSMFPFFLMSELLIEYGFIDFLSVIFGNLVEKVFHLPKEASFAIFTSLFSGFPSGSKYTKDLLERNLITERNANHLIMFTHYSNPMFIVSTIGVLLLSDKKIGFLILFTHIISNIMIGIMFRNKTYIRSNKRNKNIIDVLNKKAKARKSFITILSSAIIKSFTILVNMLGIIMFFLIITTLINKVIYMPPLIRGIANGILEMTQGIKYISGLTFITLKAKATIISFLVSFSGISVHFQVKNIIEGTAINYKNFLIARIVHCLLCSLFTYLLFDLLIH